MKLILKTEYRKKRIAERIELAHELVSRALATPRILRRLDEFGYGAPMLREGLAAAERARASRAGLSGEKLEAFNPIDFPHHLENVLEEGRELRRVARSAFSRDRVSRNQLELSFPLPNTRFLMLLFLEHFAHTLLIEEKFLRGMAGRGMDEQKIDAIARRLSSARIQTHEWRQATERNERTASEARQTIALLDRWMSDFLKVAKVALHDDPRALASVGVTVVARPPLKKWAEEPRKKEAR